MVAQKEKKKEKERGLKKEIVSGIHRHTKLSLESITSMRREGKMIMKRNTNLWRDKAFWERATFNINEEGS